eukprot:CAMPEP_0182453410 /NCGR_PEP_ID=MMETSP1319-20130603/484_1 /TAXON_ID=172717 /ORGANISM="Bolidomonas pacifica, Strain RCC208" /LENGTH=253 /DNA_ID=CAMNT_0024651341 /DNA_START=66 /DNA_END=827 /DNA_ORIENTATION=-
MILLLFVVAFAAASPALVHRTGISSSANADRSSGPVSYDTSVYNARSLLSEAGVMSPSVESIVYVLPSRDVTAHGLSIANKLEKTREAFEGGSSPIVKTNVDGGVSVERIQGALNNAKGHPSIVVNMESIPQDLEAGRTYIVNVPPSSSVDAIDASISSSMSSPPSSTSSGRVVVVASATTAQESAERSQARRLANDASSSAQYYVYMTPNILAGVLFGFMFFVVAMIGFSCMNDIEGQTVFVSKLPDVGKEA